MWIQCFSELCEHLHVDLCPDAESITITPADARWVGAWWLGYLIAGVITLLSAIPFWFLPRSLIRDTDKCTPEQTSFIKETPLVKHKCPADNNSFIEMAKGKDVRLSLQMKGDIYIIVIGHK